VFRLRIVAAKNSRNRFAACSLASATIAGTTMDASTRAEIFGGMAAGATVSKRYQSDRVCRGFAAAIVQRAPRV
jgi:hypothetical protein